MFSEYITAETEHDSTLKRTEHDSTLKRPKISFSGGEKCSREI